MDRYLIGLGSFCGSKPSCSSNPSCSSEMLEPNNNELGDVEEHSTSIGSDIDTDSDDTTLCDEGKVPNPNIKKYKRNYKYNPKWDEEFSEWLTNNNQKPYCKVCNFILEGSKSHILRHSNTKKHKNKLSVLKRARNIRTEIEKLPSTKLATDIKQSELKLCMFLSEHNLPFSLMEHLPKFLQSVCPDSTIAKHIKCSRTKATEIITKKLSPFAGEQIAKKLRKCYFSIIIDETTDISTTSCLVIVVRFYDEQIEKVQDKFLGLVKLSDCNAQRIYDSIKSLFTKYQIPLNNLIGFASDNASVMLGHLNGVKSKLLQDLPNLFVIGCTSHSLHLCASKACMKLPQYLERFVRDIYNYFSHSAKRNRQFEEFQIFTETKPHRLLRPCQTRWLSLHMVVQRLEEQWSALVLYFQAEVLEAKVLEAREILDGLNNSIVRLYIKFLNNVLSITAKANLEFQSEKPRIHLLLKHLLFYYKSILKFFIKPDVLLKMKDNIGEISVTNPHNYLDINKVSLGLEVENMILNIGDRLEKNEFTKLKVNCLNFYICLCQEMKSRFDFGDKFLNDLQILDPSRIFDNDKPSILTIVNRFSHIAIDRNEIGLEWQFIDEFKEKIEDIESMITYLKRQLNGLGEPAFKNLIILLKIIVALPHSRAAAERNFSDLNIIKSKYRNCLLTETCESLMLCKSLLGEDLCFSWTPSHELLDKN